MIFNQKTVFGLIEKHGINSAQSCFPPSTARMLERCATWMRANRSDRTKSLVLFHDENPQFAFIDHNGKLCSLFFHEIQEDMDDLTKSYLGCVKMSESFHLTPGIFDKNSLTDVVVSIMDRGQAKALKLPTCSTEVRDVLVDLPEDFDEIAFWTSLGFLADEKDPDSLPVIVLLPKILLPTSEFPHAMGVKMSDKGCF
jgi:hypothetical protein